MTLTEEQRERLLRALLGDDVSKMDAETRKILEKIAADQLAQIEPVVVDIFICSMKALADEWIIAGRSVRGLRTSYLLRELDMISKVMNASRSYFHALCKELDRRPEQSTVL